MNTKNDYSDYTAQLNSDPSYYGSDCSTIDARNITARLTQMIETQFPRIVIREWSEVIGGSASTLGPDQTVCAEIDEWIADNWTAAL